MLSTTKGNVNLHACTIIKRDVHPGVLPSDKCSPQAFFLDQSPPQRNPIITAAIPCPFQYGNIFFGVVGRDQDEDHILRVKTSANYKQAKNPMVVQLHKWFL